MVLISSPSASSHQSLQAFRSVPRTGVVYVTKEATARGYRTGDPRWSNLGQGQPETGSLPGAPPRVTVPRFVIVLVVLSSVMLLAVLAVTVSALIAVEAFCVTAPVMS